MSWREASAIVPLVQPLDRGQPGFDLAGVILRESSDFET